jgi:hypothetical protein
MIAYPLGARRADEAVRVVKALGGHRYVASRLHLVHAFAVASIPDDGAPVLADAHAWARSVLTDTTVDPASRDERLWRRASDAEVVAVVEAFWTPGARADAARRSLKSRLTALDLEVSDALPFDETLEDAMHPLLVDAGWELVPLTGLDPERHRGAIGAFGDALSFESACFEEETAIPTPVTLTELPALGPVELLRGVDHDGALARPLVVWAEGHDVYLDYVVRGVRRAAKLPERDDDDELDDPGAG